MDYGLPTQVGKVTHPVVVDKGGLFVLRMAASEFLRYTPDTANSQQVLDSLRNTQQEAA